MRLRQNKRGQGPFSVTGHEFKYATLNGMAIKNFKTHRGKMVMKTRTPALDTSKTSLYPKQCPLLHTSALALPAHMFANN